MEKLKSLVPIHLKQAISITTPDDLPRTCSSLLDFFLSSPHFHQTVGEVTDREMGLCRKNAASALDWKRKGNEGFSSGDFINALRFYTQISEASISRNRSIIIVPAGSACDEGWAAFKNILAEINEASRFFALNNQEDRRATALRMPKLFVNPRFLTR